MALFDWAVPIYQVEPGPVRRATLSMIRRRGTGAAQPERSRSTFALPSLRRLHCQSGVVYHISRLLAPRS